LVGLHGSLLVIVWSSAITLLGLNLLINFFYKTVR
jgi:hypothetical protein